MRRILLPMLLLILCSWSFGQTTMIESFDTDLNNDPNYSLAIEDGSSLSVSQNTGDFMEGTSSLNFKTTIAELHEWGSYAQIIKRLPEGEYYDWSISDTLSIWLKVLTQVAYPEWMVFRIHVADQPDPNQPLEEYIYENAVVLDQTSDWFELKVPFTIREQPGADAPNDEGFILIPNTWGGATYNNHEFDADKIIGFNIAAVTSGYTPGTNIPADSVEFLMDGFARSGAKAVPAVIFNGITFPTNMSTFTWGQSTLSVETGAGDDPKKNAIKWVQGDEWSSGWTGIGANISPALNLSGSWSVDSIKLKIKAEEGVGAMRVQFEDGAAKVGTVFDPIADNQWHDYAFPLRDMVYQDGTSNFNSAAVTVWGLMAEESAIAGKVVYLTDIWTGTPEFDVIPPDAPAGISATTDVYQNVLTWTDVPGESGERYEVYYSRNPITDIDAPGVEAVSVDVYENEQVVEHVLRAPLTDQSVTYYYAILCRDAAGNKSPLSPSSAAVTNTAKGVATISLDAPTATFAADGSLDEWQSIQPFRMFVSDGSGVPAPNMPIDSDADCSVLAYAAIDNDYLYLAFDVEDDIVSTDVSTNTYENDCPDIYLGLYDWHGAPHVDYKRGAEPDYHLRFNKEEALVEGSGIINGDSLLVPSENYYWQEDFPTGYTVEARISLAALAATGGDDVFVPVNGKRIPIDFSINDADGDVREGILTYSPDNQDLSYQNPWRWSYTWIGTEWAVGVEENENNIVEDYMLMQNYPNPFNPTTQIAYGLKESGLVTVKVYDMLGREVATLVNEHQSAGMHTVSFNARDLSSGMYLYKIESGDFYSVKKMLLLK